MASSERREEALRLALDWRHQHNTLTRRAAQRRISAVARGWYTRRRLANQLPPACCRCGRGNSVHHRFGPHRVICGCCLSASFIVNRVNRGFFREEYAQAEEILLETEGRLNALADPESRLLLQPPYLQPPS